MLIRSEKGIGLIEVLIALAILGIIAIAFLGALATASKAIFTADERATAESLARSEMEYVKDQNYELYVPSDRPSYTKDDVESSTHLDYFISIDAFPIDPETGQLLVDSDGEFLDEEDTDEGIQQIIITIRHQNKPEVITLKGYKVNR